MTAPPPRTLKPLCPHARQVTDYLRLTHCGMHAVARAPCKRCRAPRDTRLVRLSTRVHAQPHSRVPPTDRIGAAARPVHIANMLKAGEAINLCPNCTPENPKRTKHLACQRHAALGKRALIALLGGTCALCGTSHHLGLDQTLPPATHYHCALHPGAKQRPTSLGSFRYYAALARAGQAQVLCRSCNSRVTAQRPGWLQGLADARRTLTAATNQQ